MQSTPNDRIDFELTMRQLAALEERCAAARLRFEALHQPEVEKYRVVIGQAVKDFIDEFKKDMELISRGNRGSIELVEKTSAYLSWLQWTFWDLPYFAFALRLPPERLQLAIKSCGMAYLSLRILDDVLDRHFSYKGQAPSLLARLAADRQSHQKAEGLTILAAILVCFAGLERLAAAADPFSREALAQCLASLRKTTIGAIMEFNPGQAWDADYYHRLVQLKNVEFTRALHAGIDPRQASPLAPFLDPYYALAQQLNDVRDFCEDQVRGQPNLVSLLLAPEEKPPSNTARLAAALAKTILELGAIAEGLPETERLIAQVKLHERIQEALQLGVFRKPDAPSKPASQENHAPPLTLSATLEDVVREMGHGPLVQAGCALCGSAQKKWLFTKQGFSFHRCPDCGHVYVSPRLNSAAAWQIGSGLEEDPLLRPETACRLDAATICRLLQERAPGPRLLVMGSRLEDVLKLARAHEFDAYAFERSPEKAERLSSRFPGRIHAMTVRDAELPWGNFDAVVMNHVLQLTSRPTVFLDTIFRAMNPGGWLFIAVPDLESLHFQVLGKRWEAISPLTAFHYFSQETLARALRQVWFTEVQRVEGVPREDEPVRRMARLVRRLNGTGTASLAMICRRP
jgi:SAM-dependent methyltransferase